MIRIRPTKGRRPTARSRCGRIILSAFLAAIVNLPVALNAGDDEDRYGSWFFTSDEVESTSLLTPAMSRIPRILSARSPCSCDPSVAMHFLSRAYARSYARLFDLVGCL
jgi:hypothetical protein